MGRLTPLQPAPAACKCAVAKYLAVLDPDDTALFTSWLEDETIRASDITAHLKTQDPPANVGSDSIRRWRRRECSCRG
jgi:hypothetical protein